jgi:hypothetical protein
MRVLGIGCVLLAFAWALCFGVTTCVDVANAIEPTTLEEALDRPVEVKKYIDKDNSVVCYWVGRYPDKVDCVYVPRGLPRTAK